MNFISEISLFYVIPIIILSGFFTWFFYKKDSKLNEIPKFQRVIIYVSRFSILSILGFLLLGILFEFVKIREEKPILITIIDNSASLKNYKDSTKVLNKINSFTKSIDEKFDNSYEKVTYLLGNSFRKNSKIDLKDSKSNLSSAFEDIFSSYYNRNIGGIILLSDGNYNEGQNPVYAASKIPLTPIFTVGIGDTIPKKDQILKDVISNEIAFLKNKFPVEVDVDAFKIGKKTVTVSISTNGKIVASQKITYTDGVYDSKQILFELEANTAGFQQYIAEVKAIDGEYTLKNNKRSFYVEVLDSRNKILLLSGAPHPDLSAIKSVLEQDENVKIDIQTIEKWDKNLKNTDLIIWHEPGISFNENINQVILSSKIPVLYFVGPNTNSNIAQKLNIGLSFNSTSQTDEVQANFSEGFDLFEVSNELKTELPKFPPVIVRYGSSKLASQNKLFLNQKLANINKKDALLFFGSMDKRKYGVFLGEGIWRWKLSSYLKFKNHSLFNEFFQKINQFLVQKENSSNLRITLPKRFNISDDILIKAEFYNDAMELITKPKINFNLIDQKDKKSVLDFGVNGNLYLLPLGKLKAGTYKWNAFTNHAGKKYSKSGIFVVENIEIEKLDTRANHDLLKQISENSDGKFYRLDETNKLIKTLQSREDITSLSFEESSFDNLLDYIWILLTLIILLGLEWFLKRWNGFY
jgi:hypothetical protein